MDIVNLISNLGFPIAVCVAMGYYIYKSNLSHETSRREEVEGFKTELSSISDNYREDVKELTALYMSLRDVIVQNTEVMKSFLKEVSKSNEDSI